LTELRTAKDEILNSDDFVTKLKKSKETTDDIERQLRSQKSKEEHFGRIRDKFKPAAKQAGRLYFAVQDLAQLDHMYKFSMAWFIEEFMKYLSQEDEEESDEEEDNKSKINDAISSS
jgi:dynein heavy chain